MVSDEPLLWWFRDCFSSDWASLVAQLVKNGCNSGDLGFRYKLFFGSVISGNIYVHKFSDT